MTKREWNNRWRNKLASVSPQSIVHTLTTQGVFFSFISISEDSVRVARFQGDKPVDIPRGDVIRFDCLFYRT